MAYGIVIMDTSGNRSVSASDGNPSGGGDEAVGVEKTPTAAPIIEMATYAETDVFECYIRGFESRIVMRRKHDNWINITQVFKIAKFSKTQRTKVLEKESNDMENEKVQGGYGRFQGTWIPLDKAKYMVSKYNIRDPVVSKILDFELDPNNPPMKRSKNSVLKRSSPNGRITSPSSYNKTPKKKNHVSSSAASRKTKKNASLLQANPSPLQNIVFQTPQQIHAASTNNATTISAMSINNQSSNEKELNMSHLNSNETPLTMNYSATQKPLQFYPVPTNLTHPQKLSRDKQHLVNFIPEGPNQGVFASQQSQVLPQNNLVNNESAKHIGKKRKKNKAENEFLSNSMNGNNVASFMNDGKRLAVNPRSPGSQQAILTKGKAADKALYDPKMRKQQQVMWQNARSNNVTQHSPNQGYIHHTNHSNTSSLEMFSTQEDPTPLSSRSTSPTDYSGIPTAPATAVDNGSVCEHGTTNDENIEPNALPLEEYKDMILQVLSSEDGSNKDYSLPPQLYHPPANLDVNFEIDDQGHTPLHWATAMANIPLIKLLIALNANALHCNSRGFNCITKSTFYNNCFKATSFPEIASVLRICLITPDSNGRLPLHYLVELSVNKSKDPVVINSYMDTIIQNLGQEDYTLLRMCLNFQDNLGNTVLHLAALNLNLELCNKLCYLGSSMDVSNYDNETPGSILSKFNLVPPTSANSFLSPQLTKGQISTSSSILEAPVETTPGISLPQARSSQEHSNYNPPKEPNKDGKSVGGMSSQNGNGNMNEDENEGHHEEDLEIVVKDQSQLKLTPFVSSKKLASRNYLSGADSTAFTSLMEDLSNIDSFVTSSVVKDPKTSPSKLLESSPILYRNRAVTTGASLNTGTSLNTGNTNTTAVPNGNGHLSSAKLKKPVGLHESLDSPLAAIVASPVASIQNSKATTGVISLANRLREISNSLVISINAEISSVKGETESVEVGLNGIKESIKTVVASEKEFLEQFDNGMGISSVDELQERTQELQHLVDDGKQSFASCIEKSQALNLATLVQEEESKVNAETPNSPSSVSPTKTQAMHSLKLATELALLQFKRRSNLNKISDARSNINLSSKIGKYRRLIGMTIDNIDSKLDDIEMDLRANA